MEEKEELFDTLQKDIAKATADFSRLTMNKEVDEVRLTLSIAQSIELFRKIGDRVEVVWPRPNAPAHAVPTPKEARIATSLNANAEVLSALHHDQNPEASFVEPPPDTRNALLEFQKLLVTAAVETLTFEQGCEYLGFKLPSLPEVPGGERQLERSELLKILEPYSSPRLTDTLLLKPHQVTGIAAAWMMEQSLLCGFMLADDMGLGKTIEVLSTILLGAREAERTLTSSVLGTNTFKPNLILAPAAALMPWKFDARAYFGGELTLKFFYQTPAHAPKEDRASTIGVTAQDLIDSVAALDASDPRTERVVYVTSISTWAHRTIAKDETKV